MSPATTEAHAQMFPISEAKLCGKKGPDTACWEQGWDSPEAGGERKGEKRERPTRTLGGSRLGKTEAGDEARGGEKPRGSRRGQGGGQPALGRRLPHFSHAAQRCLQVAGGGASNLRTARINGGVSVAGLSNTRDSPQSQGPQTPHLGLRFSPGSWSLTLATESGNGRMGEPKMCVFKKPLLFQNNFFSVRSLKTKITLEGLKLPPPALVLAHGSLSHPGTTCPDTHDLVRTQAV